MGRKIPAKRHRGVKDPLVQQARREKRLKSKINAPPKDPDEQPIPRSLTRLFAFQRDKQDATQTRNRRKKTLQGAGAAAGNPVSSLRRLAGETPRGFSLRINSAVRALHHLDHDHYPEESGSEADESRGGGAAARRRRRRRAAPEDTLSRSQRLALKKKAKKERADDLRAAERREVVRERVAFGEVAHAPPALRGAAAADRPGRRPLLLTALLRAEPAGRREAVDAYRLLQRQRRDAARRRT